MELDPADDFKSNMRKSVGFSLLWKLYVNKLFPLYPSMNTQFLLVSHRDLPAQGDRHDVEHAGADADLVRQRGMEELRHPGIYTAAMLYFIFFYLWLALRQ